MEGSLLKALLRSGRPPSVPFGGTSLVRALESAPMSSVRELIESSVHPETLEAAKMAVGGSYPPWLHSDPVQSISSAATAIRKGERQRLLTALTNLNILKPNTVAIDIGGGKYDDLTNMLRERYGVSSNIYDPFNRSEGFNLASLAKTAGGQSDLAVLQDTLNVIPDADNQYKAIMIAHEALKPGGVLAGTVYRDAGKLAGATTKGWQHHAKESSYLPFIRDVFGSGDVVNAGSGGNLLLALKKAR